MSHIASLTIKNFACYRGTQTIELGPGCYAITAEHISDKNRSNWLGKSTLEHLITWCITGKVPNDADTLDDLITRGEMDMMVSITMSDGPKFTREKARGKSSTFTLEIEGLTLKKDDAQEKLYEYMGLTHEDMLTTCWSEQGDLGIMLNSTSGVLTKMVEQWLGEELEKLVEAGNDVANLLNQASEEHKKAVEEVDRLEKFEPLVKSYEIGIPALEEEFEKAKKEYEAAQEAKSKWGIRGKLSIAIRELDTLKTAESEMAKPFKYTTPNPERLSILEKKCRTDLDTATKARDKQKKRRDDLKKLVRGEFDGKCPVSQGFECPAKAAINSEGSKSRDALKTAEAALTVCSGIVQANETDLDEVLKAKALHAREEIEKAQREGKREELSKRIKDLEASIAKSKIEGIRPVEPSEQPPIVPQLPDNSKLVSAKMQYAQAQKAIEALPEARSRVLETATKVRAHRLALSILGPEGARRKACEGVVSSIEKDANLLLSDAGIELVIKAIWGRETGQLAEQCFECGNPFPASAKIKECSRCGSPRGNKVKHEFRWRLSNISGAAKGLGGLGIRTAAYRWAKKSHDVSWSVAFLDEVAGELDAFHRRAVSASIRKMLIGTYEQAFITAHDNGSLEACDKRMLITSDGKYSKIKVI